MYRQNNANFNIFDFSYEDSRGTVISLYIQDLRYYVYLKYEELIQWKIYFITNGKCNCEE